MNYRLQRHLRPLGTLGLFVFAIVYSFPIFYMVLSSFKKERDIAPPTLFFTPTLENYQTVLSKDLLLHLQNSAVISVATVTLTILLGVPIAYVIAFGKLKHPGARYNWYVTTTLLPAVAMIVPIYIIVSRLRAMDSIILMILLYTATGIPLMVWMCTTYMLDIPASILEASEVDGCTKWDTFWNIIVPTVRGGVISTSMLVFVVTWNEFLFAIAYTFTKAGTLPVFMNQYMTQQGLFWGKMSAVGTIAIIIPVVFGFFAQKSLIKGLLTGAVKE